MDSLDGKIAVVTGAASGIGLALTRALAARNARVVMADIDPHRLAEAAAGIDAESVVSVPTDVASIESWNALAATVQEHFGTTAHLLFNNAGVQRPGRIWNVPTEDFEWLVRINLMGAFNGVRAFVPAMIERGEPAHVVNTASISGVLGFPRIGPYAATKYGIVGLSESLLHDLTEKGAPIGVSVLCPGAVATGLAANSASIRGAEPVATPDEGADPGAVAELVLDAVAANRFWIFTHPAYDELIRRRTDWMLDGDVAPPPAPGFVS
jgi:NAD(P)-dependent dehydrogenase (short-subunit alcohol dehydrogenase family)